MKIMICGSMTFAKEMIESKEVLEEMGYSVQIPTDSFDIVGGNHDHDDLEADYNHCVENDIMRTHFKLIEESDAVLVLNYDKNNIKGYVGTASLMEIGLAYHLNKKIFLLNPLPSHLEYRWVHEVRIINPLILYGDLSRIGFVDANISLKEVADRAREIQEEIGLNFDDVLNKFTQEVGELNDAVQKRRGRFCKTKVLNDDNLKDELGDVMFNLILMCNGMNINPDDLPLFAKSTLDKFEERKELYKENLK